MRKHRKAYRSLKKERTHFHNFKNTLRKIEDHNAKYEKEETSWYMAVNQFADLTEEEFKHRLGLNVASKPNITGEVRVYKAPQNEVLPDSLDWRDKGAVLAVKNQGDCGSCWAFSVTGALEGQNAIKNKQYIPLSEQNLLDCSSSYGNMGCDGGIIYRTYEYLQENGIESETDYPYVGDDENCCLYRVSKRVLKINAQSLIDNTESALKSAVANVGPISAAMNADSLSSYGGGIFDDPECSKTVDHGILVVGYGTENNVDYWIIKNSWGTEFGEKGYFRLARNKDNQCGITNDASYPIL